MCLEDDNIIYLKLFKRMQVCVYSHNFSVRVLLRAIDHSFNELGLIESHSLEHRIGGETQLPENLFTCKSCDIALHSST